MSRNLSAEEAFTKSLTYENLKKSFLAEAALYFRCLYFESVADFEGKNEIKQLFQSLSQAGLDQTQGSFDFMRNHKDPSTEVPLGNSMQNLSSVLQTEIHQHSEIYPEMAKKAREEGFTDVASWFDTLEKMKRVHAEQLKRVYNGK
ncbi:MAG: ferritin family protein [Pseudobdellovibrio sp.]